jgi:spectrin beta
MIRTWTHRYSVVQLDCKNTGKRPHFIDTQDWLISREQLLHDGNLGETIAQVDDLTHKHEDVEKTVQAQEEKFSALQRVTIVGSHFVCVCLCPC